MEGNTHRTKTIVAGVIGNVLEWYDFALFGFLAPILSPLFFPSSNRIASLLDTYGVFALGFLMRPVGGIIFGHVGDRIGRRQALLWSVILMAIPTTAIAFLPTYDQIGLTAPILLTLIRMIQGISVGGEFIGSMSFLGEHASADRRGFYGSWCTFSGGLGNLLGSGAAALTTLVFSGAFLQEWGWRIPFLGGFAVGIVGLWLRTGISESPAFEASRTQRSMNKLPLVVALRESQRELLITIGIALMLGIGFYLPWVWLPTWLSDINSPKIPIQRALSLNTLAMCFMIALTPLGGWLSDVMGRKRVLFSATLALAVFSYPTFLLLSTGSTVNVILAQFFLAITTATIYGSSAAAFVELFPTRTRYSGIALGYNGSQALFGGTTPFVATFLIEQTGSTIAPAYYLTAAAVCCLIALFFMQDRTGQSLT